jgi:GDP-L-fucose synthase
MRFLMNFLDGQFHPLLAANRNDGLPPLMNVGSGSDISIADLASVISEIVGFEGRVASIPANLMVP